MNNIKEKNTKCNMDETSSEETNKTTDNTNMDKENSKTDNTKIDPIVSVNVVFTHLEVFYHLF